MLPREVRPQGPWRWWLPGTLPTVALSPRAASREQSRPLHPPGRGVGVSATIHGRCGQSYGPQRPDDPTPPPHPVSVKYRRAPRMPWFPVADVATKSVT